MYLFGVTICLFGLVIVGVTAVSISERFRFLGVLAGVDDAEK